MVNAEGGRETPRLALYGRVAWCSNERVESVPTGKPLHLLLLLVEHQPSAVSVDVIIDRLWGQDPPRSVANAVQRHVSRLRSSLRAFDGVEPTMIVESARSGYRLSSLVVTDSRRMLELLGGQSAQLEPGALDVPSWWSEPLVGVVAGRHVELRTRLEKMARTGARSWAQHAQGEGRHDRVLDVLSQARTFHEFDDEMALTIAESALAVGDLVLARHELDRAANISADLGVRPPPQLFVLRRSVDEPPGGLARGIGGTASAKVASRCGELWIAGDSDAAVGFLEQQYEQLDDRLVVRLRRWLQRLPFDDPNARTLWTQMIGLRSTMPEQAERALISLDSYALEHCHNGVDIARAEVDEARDANETVRALRVLFMVGLASPISDHQHRVLEQLAADPSADAQVEAARFSAFLATKVGAFDDAVEAFEETERRARQLWNSIDDLAAISISVLAIRRSDLGGAGGRTSTFPEIATDRLTFDIARSWQRLTAVNSEPALEPSFSAAVGAMPKSAGDAFTLLRDLRVDGEEATRTQAHELAGAVSHLPQTRYLHASLAALGHWAIAAQDRHVAAVVLHAVEPWRGEMLGIWPLHALLGSVDDIARELLATISDSE